MSGAKRALSGALLLADLDDFINPSQACVRPLPTPDIPEDGQVEVHRKAEPEKPPQPAKLSLNDCLACSGCVTTAETMLISAQSTEQFLSALSANDLAVVVSIAPSARTALAAHFRLSPAETLRRLAEFFKSLGVVAVLDVSVANDLALVELCAEFVARYRTAASVAASGGGPKHPPLVTPTQPPHSSPLFPLSSTSTSTSTPPCVTNGHASPSGSLIPNGYEVAAAPATGTGQDPSSLPLPFITSACPGWICYAEKKHGNFVLPYISTTKSAQQVMGSLVKHYFSKSISKTPSQVFHVCVMPCYDKKLEASRDDFYSEQLRSRDVDCVLTTGEVLDLLTERNVDLAALASPPLEQSQWLNISEAADAVVGADGSGSGGYLETVFRYGAAELFGEDVGDISLTQLKNSDFREVTLNVGGRVALRFAACYGFRNIQNVVRKIKSNSCPYHFIEIMACPSGCLNGGGQIRSSGGETGQQQLQRLTALHSDRRVRAPFLNPFVQRLYADVLHRPLSTQAVALLHTAYQSRDVPANGFAIKW